MRQRLALGEFLAIQTAVLQRRAAWQHDQRAAELDFSARLDGYLDSLPFRLTAAQRRALDEILADVAKPAPMLRLLQGEVGSGKTVVAFAAMLAAVAEGRQAALMAPPRSSPSSPTAPSRTCSARAASPPSRACSRRTGLAGGPCAPPS